MKKLFVLLCLTLFSVLSHASGISLNPPITDSSVVFLGNLFGVVDGVLSGTGSQIMGTMMGVFNSAVLALGGIVITYTILVGTMNTAHEGQALGEKWSSIWIPLRSTIGLSLLMPKATGYCLMQVFVMWVVVQGVGAADLVWNAALGYLNRGGVIIQAQQSPIPQIVGQANPVYTGALTILTGQVCMLALQDYLTQQRQNNLDLQSKKGGPCYTAQQQDPVDTTSVAAQFCNTAVPDFISSVNAVTTQSDNDSASSSYSIGMPNLTVAPYSGLNGICGTLTWNTFQLTANATTLMGSDADTVKMSRAIALQQMYTDLSATAQKIVGNAPDFANSSSCPGFVVTGANGSYTSSCYSKVAIAQWGVPYLTSSNSPCTKMNASNANECQAWGSDPNLSSSPLLAGTELNSAVADYNGIMLPSLNLNKEARHLSAAKSARAFIAGAESKGWLMAGSYYYQLVQLSGSATSGNSGLTDTNPGFKFTELSSFDTCISANQCTGSTGSACVLCQMMAGNVNYSTTPYTYNSISTKSQQYMQAIQALINGQGLTSTAVAQPSFKTNVTSNDCLSGASQNTCIATSTVYGLLNNESMVVLPGQPGLSTPDIGMQIQIKFSPGPFYIPAKSFSCGEWKFFYKVCVGRALGNIFYNNFIRYLLNFFLDTMVQAINSAVLVFLALPLEAIAVVFKYGIQSIQQTGSNPILALAMMGTTYINTSMEMWLYIIDVALMTAMIPILGVVIFALIALAMPLLISWMGVMTTIGFSTAYYVPFIPYVNFLFGSISWFMAVVEAMVAAPLIALGVSNPEGHEAFGKGESSILILLNVFLRPALMVIGFITAISLSYVSVWIINEGFDNALSFMGNSVSDSKQLVAGSSNYSDVSGTVDTNAQSRASQEMYVEGQSGYVNWAGIYAFFFASLMYTTLYLTVVQNSFNLIYQLPDKVLRWIGGGDQTGQESAQWKEEAKGKVDKGGEAASHAGGSMQKQMSGTAQEGLEKGKEALAAGTQVAATGSSPPG